MPEQTEAQQNTTPGDGFGWLRLALLDHEDAVAEFNTTAKGQGALYEQIVAGRTAIIAEVVKRISSPLGDQEQQVEKDALGFPKRQAPACVSCTALIDQNDKLRAEVNRLAVNAVSVPREALPGWIADIIGQHRIIQDANPGWEPPKIVAALFYLADENATLREQLAKKEREIGTWKESLDTMTDSSVKLHDELIECRSLLSHREREIEELQQRETTEAIREVLGCGPQAPTLACAIERMDQIKSLTTDKARLEGRLTERIRLHAMVLRERDAAQDLCGRWTKAALYSTPLNEFSLNFDATNPEAFGESRRAAVDALMTERDALQAQVAALTTDKDELEKRNKENFGNSLHNAGRILELTKEVAALITDKDLLQQKLDKTDAVFVIRCEELDYARAENTKLRQQVLDLTTDKERLDKLQVLLDRYDYIGIRHWDHDGRRLVGPDSPGEVSALLLVHDFRGRGDSKKESLRDAIDALFPQQETQTNG